MSAPTLQNDIEQVERWLAMPDAGFEELRDDLEFLRSPAHARRYLTGVREGLEAIRDGRVVPHEQIVRDMEERHRRYRPDAAE